MQCNHSWVVRICIESYIQNIYLNSVPPSLLYTLPAIHLNWWLDPNKYLEYCLSHPHFFLLLHHSSLIFMYLMTGYLNPGIELNERKISPSMRTRNNIEWKKTFWEFCKLTNSLRKIQHSAGMVCVVFREREMVKGKKIVRVVFIRPIHFLFPPLHICRLTDRFPCYRLVLALSTIYPWTKCGVNVSHHIEKRHKRWNSEDKPNLHRASKPLRGMKQSQ